MKSKVYDDDSEPEHNDSNSQMQGNDRYGRRALLLGGAAAGAGLATSLVSGELRAGAQPDPSFVQLNVLNASKATTAVVNTHSSGDGLKGEASGPAASSAPGVGPYGVTGVSLSTGVQGHSLGNQPGVAGVSEKGDGVYGSNATGGSAGIRGDDSSPDGGYGVAAGSTNGTAVWGLTTNGQRGVWGTSGATGGVGVYGVSGDNGDGCWGRHLGLVSSTQGVGVFGDSPYGLAGVQGVSFEPPYDADPRSLYQQAIAAYGTAARRGIGVGVYGTSRAAAGTGIGVCGVSFDVSGIGGTVTDNAYAPENLSAGVIGDSNKNDGVIGLSSATNGVRGISVAESGLSQADAERPHAGVLGDSTSGDGVIGLSSAANGVAGVTSGTGQSGVTGRDQSLAGGHGVSGDSLAGTGVIGWSVAASGLAGSDKAGVLGDSTVNDGVVGLSRSGRGVAGVSSSGIGVSAVCSTGTALQVQGVATFSRSGKAVVHANMSSVSVSGVKVTTSSLILATAQGYDPKKPVAVAGVVTAPPDKFTIYLTGATLEDLGIAWFAIG